ncbi:MAG: helix-turn-helix transcriptional regulator [Proteobacteria bacterium]|nr:helix-turn-helix transcriptional regulator [Desulfobulbaceae bacterium]MBU4152792.1 helix-turn-helix transcriptional regulator [Pseudomonadota bacterium]MDP2104487.1 helix-turn-helix transcriptional regulator [Desulfobulbaceae bacterium]
MDKKHFSLLRKSLGKTQKELAELLGISIKTLHSYEQGWRQIPAHAERQILFLLSRTRERDSDIKPCWIIKSCPPKRKKACPAWEFQAGKLCWFINGTICECDAQRSWKKKMEICNKCEVMKSILPDVEETK